MIEEDGGDMSLRTFFVDEAVDDSVGLVDVSVASPSSPPSVLKRGASNPRAVARVAYASTSRPSSSNASARTTATPDILRYGSGSSFDEGISRTVFHALSSA